MERIANVREFDRTPIRREIYDVLRQLRYPYGLGDPRVRGGATNICCATAPCIPTLEVTGRYDNQGWPFIREGIIDHRRYWVVAINQGEGGEHSEIAAWSRLDGKHLYLCGAMTLFTERQPCEHCESTISLAERRCNVLYAVVYRHRNPVDVQRDVTKWREKFNNPD